MIGAIMPAAPVIEPTFTWLQILGILIVVFEAFVLLAYVDMRRKDRQVLREERDRQRRVER